MRRFLILAFAAALNTGAATAADYFVPGNANPFLAGHPSGTTCCQGAGPQADSAPTNSPVLVAGITGGSILTFSATGNMSYDGLDFGNGADGDNNGTSYTFRFSMAPEYGTGVSGPLLVNANGLVGVFLDDTLPSGAAPAQLSFAGAGATTGLDFAALAPGLEQIFWIGDGLTGIGTGTSQQFTVPTGATRLFLGAVDGFGWFNNVGLFSNGRETLLGARNEH